MLQIFLLAGESLPMNAEAAGCVSVIIPARNEEINIERVVHSVAQQERVREIIVVDDGSTDRTAEILEKLESKIPILRVLRIESPPKGWTGKTNAAAAGAIASTGDWLLFTDADTFHLPGSLVALLGKAETQGADLLSISPGQETPTWWERAVIPRVFVQLARWYPYEEVSNPDSPRAAANGQYMLIRRAAYEKADGFASVRGEVLEDVAFARRIKSQGGKIVFLPGTDWVRTRMYRRFGEMWQGWTKNLYPLAGENPGRLFLAAADCVADMILFAAGLGLIAWEPEPPFGILVLLMGLTLWLAPVFRSLAYAREVEAIGYNKKETDYFPGSWLLAALLLNSWWAHRVSRRIEWKGRSYPADR